MTVQQFINYPLRDLGQIYSGQTPSPDQSADAFNVLQEILGNWSQEGLLVATHVVTTFNLTSGTSAYTMGVGATWVTTGLPVKIKGAVASLTGFQRGLEIMNMGDFEASIRNEVGIAAALPTKLGIDDAAPIRNVRLFPPPNNSSATIEVSYWVPIALFTALTDTVSSNAAFALPAFEQAVRDELTLRMAPMFRVPVTQTMMDNARSSKLALTRIDPSEPPALPEAPAAQQQQR